MMCLCMIIIIIVTILTNNEADGDEHNEHNIETNKTIEVNDSNMFSSRFVINLIFSGNEK